MIFHHVGIIVPDFSVADRMARRFGATTPVPFETVEAFSCWCAFLDPHRQVELVLPMPQSRLAKFLTEGQKSALHHVAFAVPDVRSIPFPLLFPEPAQGIQGLLVNFAVPEDGVLIELVQIR